MNNAEIGDGDFTSFWNKIDQLVVSHIVVIDRPRGTSHPRYPDMVYPLDYGYLEGTSSGDGAGIDVWMGSEPANQVTAVVCTLDSVKRDMEIKLLLGCTCDEMNTVLQFLEANALGCLLVQR